MFKRHICNAVIGQDNDLMMDPGPRRNRYSRYRDSSFTDKTVLMITSNTAYSYYDGSGVSAVVYR